MELTNPFTRQIASSWQKVFEADLFETFEKHTLEVIDKLLKDVEETAAAGLKERARSQGELCLQEAKVALQKTLDVVRDTMTTQQKETSRCLAPHVQEQLFDGYDDAMAERGRGSVARQKVRAYLHVYLPRDCHRADVSCSLSQAVFHNFVDNIKNEMFEGTVDVLFGRLDSAAEAVGKALEEAFSALAEKVRAPSLSTVRSPDPCAHSARAVLV